MIDIEDDCMKFQNYSMVGGEYNNVNNIFNSIFNKKKALFSG